MSLSVNSRSLYTRTQHSEYGRFSLRKVTYRCNKPSAAHNKLVCSLPPTRNGDHLYKTLKS